MRLTLLHTNDVHGRIDGLARIATLVERIRAETPHRVIYVDCGDVEETTQRLSSLTKGVAMHRILSAAGCEAAAVGNGVWLRYGPQVIAEQARVASYPLLLGNMAPIEGVAATALVGGIGFVGVTDPFRHFLESGFPFGFRALDEVEVVRRGARELRGQGAELVVCLSHLGWDYESSRPLSSATDRRLAEQVQGAVDVILGAHSHHLLPEGEWVGTVLVAQAGEFAQHLGRADVEDDGSLRASVIPVADDVPPHPRVLAAIEQAERELDASLDEVVAELERPLDAQWIAEILRERGGAEVGLVVEGQALDRVLPAGPLRRGELWEACHSTANPGVTELTGAQLRHMLSVAAEPAYRAERPRSLRGRARGRLFSAGVVGAIEDERRYLVAATDYELEEYGGLIDPDWSLDIRWEFPIILREAIEEHLAARQAAR